MTYTTYMGYKDEGHSHKQWKGPENFSPKIQRMTDNFDNRILEISRAFRESPEDLSSLGVS